MAEWVVDRLANERTGSNEGLLLTAAGVIGSRAALASPILGRSRSLRKRAKTEERVMSGWASPTATAIIDVRANPIAVAISCVR